LDQYGLREDTLVVVTADHGENLGEVDEMGRRRFGHEASVSDNLLRVPLVIAHPDLQPRNIRDLISIKDLYDLFIDGYETVIETGGSDISPLLPEGNTVLSEYPAVGGKEIFERYPNISRETLGQRVFDHTVVAYDKTWKVSVDSNSEQWAWNHDGAKDVNDAPEPLMSNALKALEQLEQPSSSSEELSPEEQTQLEALGYL
jgi:arylsulfatase A-like enzyme